MNTADMTATINACANHYGDQAEEMRCYLNQGLDRALNLPNRGPIKFDADGQLDPAILAAYSEFGFYVFEGVLGEAELEDIKQDMTELNERFPVSPGSALDKQGRPAVSASNQTHPLVWSKPLGDPLGGSKLASGRHQVKLIEPEADADAPEQIVFIVLGSLQFSDTALRVYGHPDLLRVAEQVNGEDFTPFNESLFIKEPGRGAAVSWHQDGVTHWDSPEFDQDIHGFNFMAQVYGSDPVNGVWVVPGTHKQGKVDIVKLVEESGSERLQDAVPLVCDAGDVVICNRQLVHGSFANSGIYPRLTVNFGFHKRSSVLGITGSGIHSDVLVYNDEVIKDRSSVIGYAIDARQKRFPDETPFVYKPFADNEESFVWDENTKASLLDYNALDLSI